MTIFDDAKREWNILTSKTSLDSPVFGETYHIRYPVESGTAEDITYKRSVFKDDESRYWQDWRNLLSKEKVNTILQLICLNLILIG